MADGLSGIHEGFGKALHRLFERHPELAEISFEQGFELGERGASAAVAPALWSNIVGDRYDTTQVTELLDVSRQALHKRVVAGSLLGIPGRGTTWFPMWQFDLGTRAVRPVVTDLLEVFRSRLGRIDPLAIASWATTPQPDELEGHSPEEWIAKRGGDERVVESARRAAAALAA